MRTSLRLLKISRLGGLALLQDMLFDEWAGHASQINNILIDPVAETVTINLLSYPIERKQDRIPI